MSETKVLLLTLTDLELKILQEALAHESNQENFEQTAVLELFTKLHNAEQEPPPFTAILEVLDFYWEGAVEDYRDNYMPGTSAEEVVQQAMLNEDDILYELIQLTHFLPEGSYSLKGLN